MGKTKPGAGTGTASLGVSVDSGETDYLSASKYLPTSLMSPNEAAEKRASAEFADIQKTNTMTSDITVDSAFDSKSPRGIVATEPTSVVNLTVNNETGGGTAGRGTAGNGKGIGGSIFAILTSKPALGFFFLYAIFATGAWAYMWNRVLRIPGLNNQIDSLKAEVDALTGQVGILTGEVDTLTGQVDRFEEQNKELSESVNDLNNTVAFYREQNDFLNTSVVNFTEQVSTLDNTIKLTEEQNKLLKNQTEKLGDDINVLVKANQNLTSQVLNVTNQNQQLNAAINNLTESNQDLSENVNNLTLQVQKVTIENEGLIKVTNDLLTITSFLNETGNNLTDSSKDLLDELAKQIIIKRNLVLLSTKNTYTQLTSNFECNYDSRFSNSPFIKDKEMSLGEENYNEVFDWLKSTYISDVCVNETDFEKVLKNNTEYAIPGPPPPVNVTSDQLIVAQSIYNTALLNYYFPDAGEPGLILNDWVNANYTCTLLPNDKRFIFDSIQSQTYIETKNDKNIFFT